MKKQAEVIKNTKPKIEKATFVAFDRKNSSEKFIE
jgi:hypothetical protein